MRTLLLVLLGLLILKVFVDILFPCKYCGHSNFSHYRTKYAKRCLESIGLWPCNCTVIKDKI